MKEQGLDPLKPEDNAKFARQLYDSEGWHPWVCARKLALI